MSLVGTRMCPPPSDVQAVLPWRKMTPFDCFPPPTLIFFYNAVIVHLNISGQ